MQKHLHSTLAAAGLALSACVAQAAPMPLTHHGFSSAGSVNVRVGPANDNHLVQAAAGAFSISFNGATFFTYCVELTQYAQLNKTYDYSLVDGLSYFGTNYSPVLAASASTVMDRLGRLFTATDGIVLPTAGTLDGWNYSAAQASAAMQLAVWEIVYEGGGAGDSLAGLSLAGGAFTETTGGNANLRTLANSYLASAAAVTQVRYDISVLRNGSYQDYLLVTRQPDRNDVPLPGTLALAGLGLLGLTLQRRRRA